MTGAPTGADAALATIREVRSRLAAVAILLSASLVLAGAIAACGAAGSTAGPGDEVRGEAVYSASCIACHGPEAAGGATGPPLVDDVYRPGHHADGAFLVAVRAGVPQHHWDFGRMPAVPGLSDQDIADVTAYVRALQRAAGIE